MPCTKRPRKRCRDAPLSHFKGVWAARRRLKHFPSLWSRLLSLGQPFAIFRTWPSPPVPRKEPLEALEVSSACDHAQERLGLRELEKATHCRITLKTSISPASQRSSVAASRICQDSIAHLELEKLHRRRS